MLKGHCLCGQLSFETSVEPKWIAFCHCASCGSPIAYQVARRAGEIDLYINAFDEPENLRPQLHVHTKERLPWFDVKDDLPREE